MTARKYGNVPVTIGGHRFASQAEARRYLELLLLEKAGVLRDLRLQVRYPLSVNGVTVAHYVADFVYDTPHGDVVEDVKGFYTPLYRLKRKLMHAIYGINISEVPA